MDKIETSLKMFKPDQIPAESKQRIAALANILTSLSTDVNQLHSELFDPVRSSYAKSKEYAEKKFQTLGEEFKVLAKSIDAFDKDFSQFEFQKNAIVNYMNSKGFKLTLSAFLLKINRIENNLEVIISDQKDLNLEALEFQGIAQSARIAALNQIEIAANLLNRINSYTGQAAGLQLNFTTLVNKLDTFEALPSTANNEPAIRNAAVLVKTAKELKTQLDANVMKLNAAKYELEKLDLNEIEQEVNEIIQTSNEFVERQRKKVINQIYINIYIEPLNLI